MQINNSVNFYDAISGRLGSYLLYPNDKGKRAGYYSKLLLDNIYENKMLDLPKIFVEHSQVMAEISPLANQYRSPNKGYSLRPCYIAGHLLLAMIRMKISGIDPSLQKAYYFYMEITQKDPMNWGIEKSGIRQIEQVWSEFKSIAHLGLVIGKLGNTQNVKDYPVFLSSIYRVQKLYLDIIKESEYLNFEIWEFPFLDQLTWKKNNKVYPPSFIMSFYKTLVFDKLNSDELNIMHEYSKAYFKRGGAR